MIERDPTRIGQVRHVLGSTVTVALDGDLAGTAPIYRSRLQPVGQIGSLVRIPQGPVDLIATVGVVGIAELTRPLEPAGEVQHDDRWLRVELLGTLDHGTGSFERGVGSYPGLDDPVHFATPDELRSVFPPPGEEYLRIGCLAAAEQIPVCLQANRFVIRHGAIVGSTGSGKTSAVASLLQRFANEGWDGANIVVIDPHGEYAGALASRASVRSVLARGDSQLRVPFWALPAAEIARIFAGTTGGATFERRYTELVTESRKRFVESCTWLTLDPAAVTADTPVPFDLREVWYQLDYENKETREVKGDPDTVSLIEPGNPSTLSPASFQPHGAGSQPPHQGPLYSVHGTTPDLLRLGLLSPQLRFFQEPQGATDGTDPLVDVMREWLGRDRPVSVLDFGGVPTDAADLAIGVVLNLVFEVAVRCSLDSPGIGRPSPVLIVLEEAHRYLGAGTSKLTRDAANRIAREGRKYGVGLLLVTQRPTELPDTALAQCGTLVALRLSNSEDQNTIRAALPDAIDSLAAVLPSLRTGEAIVSGESVILPARVLLDLPDPQPDSDDPTLTPWRGGVSIPDVSPALLAWRGTFETEDEVDDD